MIQLTAMHVRQKDVDLYLTAMNANVLRDIIKVDRWSSSGDLAYQRPEIRSRHAEIARYLRDQEGVLPTSILLSARPDSQLQVEGWDISSTPRLVHMTISDASQLWVVDGQHRIGGLLELASGPDAVDNYAIPVTVMDCPSQYFEMQMFNIVNTRQKPVPQDIVDQHLKTMYAIDGNGMQASMGRKGLKRGRATTIIEMLNELPCPWEHQVRIPNVTGREDGILRGHSLVVSLEVILDDSLIRSLSDDDTAEFLAVYWNALSIHLRQAFIDPLNYSIQKQVGIHVMHRLFPHVLRLCQDVDDYSLEMMEKILRWPKMPSGGNLTDSRRWHITQGNPETRDSKMGPMRSFADHLKRHLPLPQRIE